MGSRTRPVLGVRAESPQQRAGRLPQSFLATAPSKVCECGGGVRFPDFASASVSIALPYSAGLGSWSFSVSADRYGNWYWSPIGPGAGRAPTLVSATATANWLNQSCKPTQQQLNDFLSGHGATLAGGYWAGGNAIYSHGNGWAFGGGLATPQLGANYSYSWQGLASTGLSW
jgi:hypothetical protein